MKIKKLLFLIALVLLFSGKSFAQGEGNFWFFGNFAGLDFNPGPPTAITVGALTTTEGCAAISDASGNLLFYTDGINVWNNTHVTMPNGTGLLGDPSSTQSGIIVPKPGSSTIYYIFTTAAQGDPAGLCYSEVDMTLDGGLGDVTVTKNIPLFTPVTEKLTAVKNSNNVDYWVIAHNNDTDEFLVYAVTSAGVTVTPIISATGTIDTSTLGIGYLKSSSDGSKLVSAMDFISTVDVLDFNTTTGVVSFNFSFTYAAAYGVEFSPNGSRLYVAAESSPDIYQYDMTLGSSTAIIASATLIGTSGSTVLGALQNAPDKKMYVARYTSNYLACIPNPDSLGTACGFDDNAVDLLGETAMLGLPNFITSFFRASPFNYVNTCVGDTTFFSLVDSIAVDSIHWDFGDPASGINNISNAYAPYHIFSGVGAYRVYSIDFKGSVSDTATDVVHIIGDPIITLGSDTSICTGNSITIGPGGGYTYIWQDGTTNSTFNAPAGGTYYVKVTGRCGVSADTIQIGTIALPPVVVNDTAICLGQTVHLTVHGADTYIWHGLSYVDSTATANPTVTTTYTVKGTVTADGCSATDTFTVTVKPIPVVTANSTAICIGDTVRLTAAGASGYVWSTTDTTDAIQVVPSTTTTYSVTGTTAGCSDSATATVSVTLMPVVSTSGDATLIAGFTTNLTATGGTGYSWSPGTDLSCTACANPVASPLETTTYCVVVDNGLCADSSCLTITVEQPCPDVKLLQIPDAFSPNGDGNNDYFLLQEWGRCTQDFSIVIYDRWGEKMFESTDPDFAWDGTYKGKRMDPGVFVYIAKALLKSNIPVERRGNITLIR